MSFRRLISIVALAAATLVCTPLPAHADAADPTDLRIITQAQVDAQMQGQGLAHRHLPTCQGLDSVQPAGQIAVLDYMAGAWQGVGWSQWPGQARNYFVQNEVIHFIAADTLEVTGTGHDPADLSRETFHAHALVSPRADGSIQWLAGFAPQLLPTTLVVLPDGWSWDMPMGPGVLVRYQTYYTNADRAWHETGMMTTDGGVTWTPVEQMTLIKTCTL